MSYEIAEKYPLRIVKYQKKLEGGMVCNPETKEYSRLNKQGAKILEKCDGKKTVNDIVQEISEETGINIKKIESSVAKFLKNVKGSLVTFNNQPQKVGMKYRVRNEDPSYSPPREIVIGVTNKCNLSCDHCMFDAGDYTENEMSTEEIKKVIDDSYRCGAFDLIFTGGEPLLRDDLIELLEYAKSRGFDVGVISNGILVDEVDYKEIGELTDSFEISVDGSNKKVHEELRGDGWKETIKGCKLMSEVNSGFNIGSIIRPGTSFDELEKRIELAIELEAKRITFETPIELGRADKNNLQVPVSEQKKFPRFFKKMVEKYGSEINIIYPGKMGTPLDKPDMDGLSCGLGDSCTIKSSGDVYPCPMFILDEFELGNVRENSLDSILSSSEIFKEMTNISIDKINDCSDCEELGVRCAGGCRARAYVETGDIYGKSPCVFRSQ